MILYPHHKEGVSLCFLIVSHEIQYFQVIFKLLILRGLKILERGLASQKFEVYPVTGDVYPGPPEYTSVEMGDYPEEAAILSLKNPILGVYRGFSLSRGSILVLLPCGRVIPFPINNAAQMRCYLSGIV